MPQVPDWSKIHRREAEKASKFREAHAREPTKARAPNLKVGHMGHRCHHVDIMQIHSTPTFKRLYKGVMGWLVYTPSL